MSDASTDNPCQQCGACCAHFRVSFYWAETDAHPYGTVPERLTIPVAPHYVAMQGTDKHTVTRCVALAGEIGDTVGCTIYEQRSSTCREFDAGTPACNRAREKHGLHALA
jgi:Fe-S-cluster containining protein